MEKISNNKKELGGKSALAFVAQILGHFLSVIYVALAGHLVGKNDYGTFVYILSLHSFITAITKFGFSNSLVAYISRDDVEMEKKRWIVDFSIKISMLLCLAVSVIFIAMGDAVSVLFGKVNMDRKLFLITLPFLFFKTAIEVLSAVVRGNKDVKGYFMGSLLLGNIIRVIGLPLVVYGIKMNNVYSMVYVYYVSYIINTIYCIYLVKKEGFVGRTKDVYPWRSLVSYTFPLMFTGMIQILNKEIDSYMIGLYIDSGQVAIYNVAANIGLFSSFTLVAVNSIFAPMVSELYRNGDIKELGGLYTLSTKWIITVNVMIVGMVMIFPNDIMHLAGDEFAEGGIVLVIIIIGQLVNSGMGSVGFLNSMTGHGVYNLISNSSALITNIVLNLLLIEKYGVVGVGIATAASVATNNIVNYIFVYKNLRLIPYTRQFIKIPVVMAFSIPILYLFKMLLSSSHFILRMGIAGIVYVPVFAVLTYLLICEKDEKNVVKKAISEKVVLRKR